MNLLRTLLTISGMTMLSRITGLLRELLIARAFGASGFTDAFFVAFRIPNLLRRLFAEGAFSQAFVPILAEYANKKGTDPAKELIDKVATALMWTLLLITVVGILGRSGCRLSGCDRSGWQFRNFRTIRVDDADYVSLHSLYVDGRSGRRHFKYLA